LQENIRQQKLNDR
jgi:hypothetical protein